MRITIELASEESAALCADAALAGIGLEDLLRRRLVSPPNDPRERLARAMEMADLLRGTMRSLPLTATDRESLYGDR